MPALFPFKLTLPDGTVYDPVKILTDGRTVRVYGMPNGRTVELVAESEETLVQVGQRRRTWTMATGMGEGLVEPARGCGCGHPLKRFVPPKVPA